MRAINKKEIENLIEIKGEVRGAVFQTDAKYVLDKEGEEGLRKLEEKAKSLGCEIDYRETKATDWYPASLRIISLLLIKETFNWLDSEIREMGKTAPKFSFMVKFIFKIFAPTKKLVKEIAGYWKEHYTVGELIVTEFDEKNKKMVLNIKDFKVHPIFCLYLEGYFERILLFVEKGVKVKETECMFKGASHHEYLFTWE